MKNQKQTIFAAVTLFALSYTQLFIPNSYMNSVNMTFFWAANWLGLVLLGDYLSYKFSRTSLLHVTRANGAKKLRLVLAMILGGIAVEGFFQWVGKLWFYPLLTDERYFLLFIPGFALYILAVTECYLGCKAVLSTSPFLQHLV